MVGPAPAADPTRSPYTGWTRAHWAAIADDWLGMLRRYASPRHALPVLPGRVTASGVRREGMETIGRSFLLAAPRIAGAAGEDPLHLADWYAEALLAGTEPDGPEAWPLGVTCRRPLTGITNPIVEAANIAFGLHVSREWLWDRLSRREQDQIAGWLLHHARCEVWQNNWQLFPAMAEAFLASVGADTSGCTGARNVARVESWYLGDGWYTDGPEHAVDHYNAWVIHPYLWAWYRMRGATDRPGAERYLERLAAFVDSYAWLFAPDGAVLHQGRSLTYRTGVLAPFWVAEWSGVSPLAPGATRRLASGVLANFVRHGVGVDGPLTLGWYGEHLDSCQAYSGFGSPYVAGIGFLGLALPADHRVWTEPETGQPTDDADAVRSMPSVGWVVSATRSDGIVRLVNHGSDHCGLPVSDGADPDDPHYAKFGYSTHSAPGTGPAWAAAVDGTLAVLTPDGVAGRRGPIRATRTVGAVAGSCHLPQRDGVALPGCAVSTVSVVDGGYELRCHLVTAPADHPVREGGHPLAATSAPPSGTTDGVPWVRDTDGVLSAVVPMFGWDAARVVPLPGGTAFGPAAAVPAVFAARAGERSVHVALHVLTRGEPDPPTWRAAVTVEISGTTVLARWASGASHRVNLATFVAGPGPARAA